MLRMMWEFFKAGLFAVGGGMATIPFLQAMGEKYGYFTSEELLDMIAVSESTPGAIGINMATYAGIKAHGPLGGILATIALVTGPIIIILIIARMILAFKNSKIVKDAFSTLRPATAGLILGAMSTVLVLTLVDTNDFAQTGNFMSLLRPIPLGLFAAFTLILFKFKNLSPLWIIVAGAGIGIVVVL